MPQQTQRVMKILLQWQELLMNEAISCSCHYLFHLFLASFVALQRRGRRGRHCWWWDRGLLLKMMMMLPLSLHNAVIFDITPCCVGVLVSPNESVAFSCWILCVIDCLIVFGLFFDLCSISKIKYDFLHFPCGIECVVFWCCSFTGLEKCFCVTASDVWLRLLVFPPFRCSMSHLLQSMPFLWSVVILFVHSILIEKQETLWKYSTQQIHVCLHSTTNVICPVALYGYCGWAYEANDASTVSFVCGMTLQSLTKFSIIIAPEAYPIIPPIFAPPGNAPLFVIVS